MSVLVVGMSHRSAPVDVLERVSMDEDTTKATTTALVAAPSLSEAMIVSTCNRVEVYAVTNSFHTGVGDVVAALHDVSGVDVDTLRQHLYVRYADAAAEHVLRVAAGLDSMVMGEQQIIGQVRGAYTAAHEVGTVGPALHALSQAALHTGKRVHSETDLNEAGPSMVTFALAEALRLRGWESFAGKRALILGAGVMASLAGSHLAKGGIEHIIYANRTRSRADSLVEHALAAGTQASAVDYAARAAVYGDVDVIVSATGADTHTVAAADLPHGHELTLIDLSMPRDIDDNVQDHGGVILVNIEHLHTQARADDATGKQAAEDIVAAELAAYSSAQRVLDVVPAVAALRRHAADIVAAELERLDARTPGMGDKEREETHRALHRVVDKLLHQPTVAVKDLAARSASVSYDQALQELFGLD
ncbi:glutamyl-tRNA reductase [Corynebacterium sp. 13CS0277]|uniref:glutamyl-tRNA reductase n=1 Tax=Corynebacterium sp. 13CS0277 TaxID=2071994 RepID=UPI000D03DD22|nr:glutamyl-tRNA reductase [Corynebacterium sp. 13CS0277]PRQ10679.1 glutamyl-tRNA reductase [Corynebacterium sp. 13CS0277]